MIAIQQPAVDQSAASGLSREGLLPEPSDTALRLEVSAEDSRTRVAAPKTRPGLDIDRADAELFGRWSALPADASVRDMLSRRASLSTQGNLAALAGLSWTGVWPSAQDARSGPARPGTGRDPGQSSDTEMFLLQLADPAHALGVAVSVAVAWWLTRGGGAIAGALADRATWRHLDIAPMLDDKDPAQKEPHGHSGADVIR
jgi:hypothetical protein